MGPHNWSDILRTAESILIKIRTQIPRAFYTHCFFVVEHCLFARELRG